MKPSSCAAGSQAATPSIAFATLTAFTGTVEDPAASSIWSRVDGTPANPSSCAAGYQAVTPSIAFATLTAFTGTVENPAAGSI